MEFFIWFIVIIIAIPIGKVLLIAWTINKLNSCTEDEYEKVFKPFYEKYKDRFPPECQLRAAYYGTYNPSTKSEEELRVDLICGIKHHILEMSDLFYQGHLRQPTDEELANSMTAELAKQSCGYLCNGCNKQKNPHLLAGITK